MSATEPVPGRGVYVAVFLALLALMAATVAVAYVDLGAWSAAVAERYGELGRWNTVAAMTIAFVKAVLVVLYFMHVRYGRPLVGLVAIAGFMWLALLIGGVATDYFSRGWLAPSPPVVLPE